MKVQDHSVTDIYFSQHALSSTSKNQHALKVETNDGFTPNLVVSDKAN